MLLHKLVEKNAQDNPDKEAVVFQDQRIPYKELNRKAESLAYGLLKLGVKHGEIIGVLMPSRVEYIVLALGCWKIGAAILTINFHYTNAEIAYTLNNASVSKLVMVDQYKKYNYAARITDLKSRVSTLEKIICVGETINTDLLSYESLAVPSPTYELRKEYEERTSKVSVEDMAFLIFSGGTTGVPKGAIITHRARYSVDKAWGDVLGVNSDDRFLIDLPLFHLFVWHLIARSFISSATIVLMEEYDTEKSLQTIERERVTFLTQVPTMYIYQVNSPNVNRYDLTSLRIGLTGGALFPEELFDKTEQILGGIRIINTFGLTEDGGLAVCNRLDSSSRHLKQYAGKPIKGFEMKIVDEDRKTLKANEVGEIALRASWIKGYYLMPEEMEKTFDSEGWLYTGDLGSMDEDGYVVIKGRKKEMYISGGENIFPIEIETVVQKHPKVMLAAVIGVPHPMMGEVGKLYVVPKEGEELTEDEIRAYCKTELASIKNPREIVIRASLPQTKVGKIKKEELKKEIS
ncbi:MAG: class I adenylate-forming enzyme family protein [Dethiobacteria bacterium]|jgi:acyl-CoA synthetase (AMP-forming)/AMP-acid ligase II